MFKLISPIVVTAFGILLSVSCGSNNNDTDNSSKTQSIISKKGPGEAGRVLFALPHPDLKGAVCVYSRKNIGDKEFKILTNAITTKDHSKIGQVLKLSSSVNKNAISFSKLKSDRTALVVYGAATTVGGLVTAGLAVGTGFSIASSIAGTPAVILLPLEFALLAGAAAATADIARSYRKTIMTANNADTMAYKGPLTLSNGSIIDAIEARVDNVDLETKSEMACPASPAI